MTENSGYVAVATASEVTGIPGRTLRRWIARGQVPAVATPHGRLVDLAAVQALATTVAAGRSGVATGQMTTERPRAGHQSAVTGHDVATLLALVDRVTRENLELAGRLGFVTAELEQARQTIRLLSPTADPERPRRPWWQRWWPRQQSA